MCRQAPEWPSRTPRASCPGPWPEFPTAGHLADRAATARGHWMPAPGRLCTELHPGRLADEVARPLVFMSTKGRQRQTLSTGWHNPCHGLQLERFEHRHLRAERSRRVARKTRHAIDTVARFALRPKSAPVSGTDGAWPLPQGRQSSPPPGWGTSRGTSCRSRWISWICTGFHAD